MLGPYPTAAVIERLALREELKIVGGAADLDVATKQPPRAEPEAASKIVASSETGAKAEPVEVAAEPDALTEESIEAADARQAVDEAAQQVKTTVTPPTRSRPVRSRVNTVTAAPAPARLSAISRAAVDNPLGAGG